MKMISLKQRILGFFLFLSVFGMTLDALASPPPWAPAHGYRAKTRYVYFPQQNFYFDLKTNNYIYLNGSSWLFSVSVPTIFGSINLATTRQVELDYYSEKPYVYNKKHVVVYKNPAPDKVKVTKVKANKSYAKGSHGNGKAKGKGPK